MTDLTPSPDARIAALRGCLEMLAEYIDDVRDGRLVNANGHDRRQTASEDAALLYAVLLDSKGAAERHDAKLRAENEALAGQVAALRDIIEKFWRGAYWRSPNSHDAFGVTAALSNTAAAAEAHDVRIRRVALAQAMVAINGADTLTGAAQAVQAMMGETDHG